MIAGAGTRPPAPDPADSARVSGDSRGGIRSDNYETSVDRDLTCIHAKALECGRLRNSLAPDM
jgi:hypothetical protein